MSSKFFNLKPGLYCMVYCVRKLDSGRQGGKCLLVILANQEAKAGRLQVYSCPEYLAQKENGKEV